MKKKLFGTMVVVAAMFAGYNVYDAQNESELTGVALANVEALASNENNPCDNKNGYKKWNSEDNFWGTDRTEGFYDCCYQSQDAYNPNTECE